MTPCYVSDCRDTSITFSNSVCDWASLLSPRQAEVLAMLNEAFDGAFGTDESPAAYEAA